MELNQLGYDFKEKSKLMNLGSMDFHFGDFIRFIAHPRDPEFLELQTLFFQIRSDRRVKSEVRKIQISNHEVSRIPEFEQNEILNLKFPGDSNPNNGNNKDFKWFERGTFDELARNGHFYQALRNLNEISAAKGIRLVVYDTPTVTHRNAPHIYPAGYLEKYLIRMRQVCQELKIPYRNYSGLFPWSKNATTDFIHPTPPAREILQKRILHDFYLAGGS